MPELYVQSPKRTSARLQVIAGGRVKPAALPCPVVRALIYRRYESGETEREISKRMDIGIESVRLTLRGFHEITRRLLARSGARVLRAQEAEVATEVWSDLGRRRAA